MCDTPLSKYKQNNKLQIVEGIYKVLSLHRHNRRINWKTLESTIGSPLFRIFIYISLSK